MSGKIARALLGTCESAVRDLVQHVGCNIQHASMLLSQIVSLIIVSLLCRAGNRQYFIVDGFAIHEHFTPYMIHWLHVYEHYSKVSKTLCLSTSIEPILLLEMYACWLARDTTIRDTTIYVIC